MSRSPEDISQLQTLLEQPLDPNLDYFDATASIEALAEHVRGLHKLIQFLASGLVERGQAIISLKTQVVELEADLLAAGIRKVGEQEWSSLIGFEKPKLEVN